MHPLCELKAQQTWKTNKYVMLWCYATWGCFIHLDPYSHKGYGKLSLRTRMSLGLITPGAVLLVRSKTFFPMNSYPDACVGVRKAWLRKFISSVNTLKVTDKKPNPTNTKQHSINNNTKYSNFGMNNKTHENNILWVFLLGFSSELFFDCNFCIGMRNNNFREG